MALSSAAMLAACEPLHESRARTTVHDPAGLFDARQRAAIEAHHDLLRADYGIDYRVETVRAVGDLDRYAAQRFGDLAVGSAGGERGLLLVIDAQQDELRLEVGRALEGVFPDAFVAYVEQRQMVPFFRASRVGDGVLAATELLVGQVERERARDGLAGPPVAGSGGGGARARARISDATDPAERRGAPVGAADTPEETVARYLEAVQARNTDPNLDIYSADTRRMLARGVMTPAQMDTLLRTYRGCRADPVQVDRAGTHAVLRYPVAQRACAPWLLRLEEGHWRLDFATASAVVRFGRDNSWRFAQGAAHPYAFAFADWRFDRHGFPQEPE